MNDVTELGDFLNTLAIRIIKEGVCLSAMARDLLAETGEDEEVLVQIGVDISELGRELLMAKKQLCPACMIKELAGQLACKNVSENENQ